MTFQANWSEERKNLLTLVEKYPSLVANAIDAACLCGLDTSKERIDDLKCAIEVLTTTDPDRESDEYDSGMLHFKTQVLNLFK